VNLAIVNIPCSSGNTALGLQFDRTKRCRSWLERQQSDAIHHWRDKGGCSTYETRQYRHAYHCSDDTNLSSWNIHCSEFLDTGNAKAMSLIATQTIFSMGFFNFSDDRQSLVVSPWMWVYCVISIGLTVLVGLVWILLSRMVKKSTYRRFSNGSMC